ncbi:hypothetical protein DSO57_1021481 [Entomophthora muscae]|uniref:Uncharacterized protein n=1 Tax=Entomophthora muscae TaxID=34485 RepID=A0ACC2UP83_9FUNG|nr:hypothetical protein DSO57_1021481 [Entomophthora muscae]
MKMQIGIPFLILMPAQACLEIILTKNYTSRKVSGFKAKFVDNDVCQGSCEGEAYCCTTSRYCISFDISEWSSEYYYVSRPGWTGRLEFSRRLSGLLLGWSSETNFGRFFCLS